VHLPCTPTALSIGRVETKPPNKEDVHLRRGAKSCPSMSPLSHHDVVDTDDSRVPIWESRATIHPIFMRQDHDIGMCPGISGLFYPVSVICRRVELNGLVIIQSILFDDDAVALAIREGMLVPIVWPPFDARV
jgi:hypothetical protein